MKKEKEWRPAEYWIHESILCKPVFVWTIIQILKMKWFCIRINFELNLNAFEFAGNWHGNDCIIILILCEFRSEFEFYSTSDWCLCWGQFLDFWRFHMHIILGNKLE